MDGDAVAALGLAGAFVREGVVGCDFGAEGEGEEEGEDGEEWEAHCCGCCWGVNWDGRTSFEGSVELKQLIDGPLNIFENSRTDFGSHELNY